MTLKYSQLYTIPQWTKSFWNPCMCPVTSEELRPRDVYYNLCSGDINGYNFNWHDSDTHELFLKQYKSLNPLYHDKEINYTFNVHGYRSESFDTDADLKIIVLGCSVAFGTGIDDADIWSTELLKLLNDKFDKFQPGRETKSVRVYNLAIPGASADLNAITLYQLIGIINPDIVIWIPPFSARRSVNYYYLTEDQQLAIEPKDQPGIQSGAMFQHLSLKVVPSNLTEFPGMEHILNDAENYNNLVKNHALINEICLNNNAIFTSFHNQLILSDAFEYFKHSYSGNPLPWSRKSPQDTTGIAVDLFYELDNVVSSKDLIKYSKEFFSKQSMEDIHTDIKYPHARDNIHQGEMFHKFLAYIASNVISNLLPEDFHI